MHLLYLIDAAQEKVACGYVSDEVPGHQVVALTPPSANKPLTRCASFPRLLFLSTTQQRNTQTAQINASPDSLSVHLQVNPQSSVNLVGQAGHGLCLTNSGPTEVRLVLKGKVSFQVHETIKRLFQTKDGDGPFKDLPGGKVHLTVSQGIVGLVALLPSVYLLLCDPTTVKMTCTRDNVPFPLPLQAPTSQLSDIQSTIGSEPPLSSVKQTSAPKSVIDNSPVKSDEEEVDGMDMFFDARAIPTRQGKSSLHLSETPKHSLGDEGSSSDSPKTLTKTGAKVKGKSPRRRQVNQLSPREAKSVRPRSGSGNSKRDKVRQARKRIKHRKEKIAVPLKSAFAVMPRRAKSRSAPSKAFARPPSSRQIPLKGASSSGTGKSSAYSRGELLRRISNSIATTPTTPTTTPTPSTPEVESPLPKSDDGLSIKFDSSDLQSSTPQSLTELVGAYAAKQLDAAVVAMITSCSGTPSGEPESPVPTGPQHTYIFYYRLSGQTVSRPVGVFSNGRLGWTPEKPLPVEGQLSPGKVDVKSRTVVNEADVGSVLKSTRLVSVTVRGSAVVRVYGENGSGYAFSTGGVLKLVGQLLVAPDDVINWKAQLKKQEDGDRKERYCRVEALWGRLALYICDQNILLLVCPPTVNKTARNYRIIEE